jgi:hypothetical protein
MRAAAQTDGAAAASQDTEEGTVWCWGAGCGWRFCVLSAESYGRMVSPARDFLQLWATAAISLPVAGLG